MNILYTFERKMVAQGSAFIIYEITANSLALLGFILALTGRGWLRRSASVISLVMMFQWFGMFFISPGLQQYITIASFTTLFVWGITSFAWVIGKWRRSQVARTSSPKNDFER
jgi:CDP-diglyceride synthetase